MNTRIYGMEKEPNYSQTVLPGVHAKAESGNVRNKLVLLMDQLVMPMVILIIKHLIASNITFKETVNMFSPLLVPMMNSVLS